MVAPIITIRPGPVLHVWQNGKPVAEVPLTPAAAIMLCRDVLAEVKFANHD